VTKLTFPYVNFRGKYYPLIPVRLRFEDRSLKTLALVDSGATMSVFRGEIAEALGIRLRSGEEIFMQSANARFKTYAHTLALLVNDYEFSIKVSFSTEVITSFNIIGREGFFEHFRVMFSERERKVLLDRY